MSVTMAAQAGEWAGYINEEFSFTEFPPGARILDVGFGNGEQMRRMATRGCHAVGLDLDPQLVARGRAGGLAVCRSQAEALPFRSATFDGLVCKVVIPYTDEARAVDEIARVLRPGGTARVSYHGSGYFLRYLLTDANWKRRLYGLRTIVNTWLYALTGRRLGGFWGDTVYQSEGRLDRYYRQSGLEVVERHLAPHLAGGPVFIYHVLRRR